MFDNILPVGDFIIDYQGYSNIILRLELYEHDVFGVIPTVTSTGLNKLNSLAGDIPIIGESYYVICIYLSNDYPVHIQGNFSKIKLIEINKSSLVFEDEIIYPHPKLHIFASKYAVFYDIHALNNFLQSIHNSFNMKLPKLVT